MCIRTCIYTLWAYLSSELCKSSDKTHSYVRHDWFMRDMTHSWDKWLKYDRHESCMRDTTYSQETWHTCHIVFDMTHSHVWHDSFTCVTWLIHMCDMTHSHVWHDSSDCVTFMSLTWIICMCHVTHCDVRRDSFSLGLLVAEGHKAGISFERFVKMKWFQNQLNFADVSIYTCIFKYKPKFKCSYVQIDLRDLDAGIGGAWIMPSTHSHCNTLHRTAIWEMRIGCLLLQFSHAATRCNALQHAATRCNTPQHANSTM